MRLNARAPIIIRGDEIAHLDADGYKHLPRAASLPDGKILASSGGAWRPSDLSGVSVSSVFGRTGAVAAQTGDYTAAQVGAEPYAGVPAQTSFWRSTAAGVRAWVQLVAADITDLATTLASYLTKADPTFTGALKQGATTRITAGGDAWFESMQATNLLGAGDRPIAADLTGTIQPKTPAQFRSMISALSAALKGAANGVAELGADGRVPTTQLPPYLALGETAATAHRGDHGVIAYNHSQATGNPHGTTAADVGAAKAPSKQDVSASANLGSIDASAIKVTATDVTLTCSGGFDGQGWDIIGPYAIGIGVPSGVTLYRFVGVTVGPATYAPGGGRALRVVRVDASTWIMPNLS